MKKYIALIIFLLVILWAVVGQERTPVHEPVSTPTPFPKKTFTPVAPESLQNEQPFPQNDETFNEEEVQGEAVTPLITGFPPLNRSSAPLRIALGNSTPTPTPLPEVQALQEIQQLTEQVPERVRGGPPPEDASNVSRTTTKLDDEDPGFKSSLGRVSGQPRGFVMLYAMHPKARPSVERQVQILLDSKLDNLYLSVLIDGTFSFDEAYLSAVIQRLNADNRTLALQLYLVSGPTMRRWETTPIETLFSRINPEDFRYLIEEDQQIRNDFKSIARKANSFFDLNKSFNELNRNYVTVMLEDNLDAESYKAMRSLAKEVIGERAVVIRNPCPGCFEGNDSESFGDSIEYHALRDFDKLHVHDAYTLDGTGYRYGDEPGSVGISIEETKQMIEVSFGQEHKYFGLWRADRQGLGSGGTQLDHPDNRTYAVPTEEEARVDIELLRHGLTFVATSTPTPIQALGLIQ